MNLFMNRVTEVAPFSEKNNGVKKGFSGAGLQQNANFMDI
jgi:hypothetical protein